jgi:REP-associated tyrosine transposase
MHAYLGGILLNQDCQPVLVGGVEDHVHILSTLGRTTAIATLVKEVKRSSTMWLKAKGKDFEDFAWQSGYGAFSIGFSQLGRVCDYIATQEDHHREMTFQDEFRRLLARYEIEFDERYIWD